MNVVSLDDKDVSDLSSEHPSQAIVNSQQDIEIDHLASVPNPPNQSANIGVLSRLRELPLNMLFVIACGLFLDGLLYALSYVLDTTTGLVVAIAFAVETGVLGLLISTSLRKSGVSNIKVALTAFLFTIFTLLGVVVGGLSFSVEELQLSLFFLSFGSAVFLYMVIDSLLVEARQVEIAAPWRSKFCFYVGFIGIFVLDLALV